MTLVFFKGLGVSCYVGGIGGFNYLTEAHHVADRLQIPFPPVAFWRPHDRYLGIGQLAAILEFKRITGSLNVSNWEKEVEDLRFRIDEVYRRVGELEVEKEQVVKRLRLATEHKETLLKTIRELSRRQGQLKRASNLSVLNRDLKILENVAVTLDLIPSIIDYAVNVGLQETSRQWIEYLEKDGDLRSDIYLKSVLDDLIELEPFISALPYTGSSSVH